MVWVINYFFKYLTIVKNVHVYKDMFYEVSLGMLKKFKKDLNSFDAPTFHNEEGRNLRVTESLKAIDFGHNALEKILKS